MRHHRNVISVCVILVLAAMLGACSAKSSIVGKWQFETVKGSWAFDEMEFHEQPYNVSAFHGNYMNLQSWYGSWSMPSSNRLELMWSSFNGQLYAFSPTIYEVKISGNRLEIADEHGNRAVGTRLSSASSSGARLSRGSAGVLLWALLILLAAGVAGVLIMRRRVKPQGAVPAGNAAPARPVAQAFCMHCGQPVQAGSKFCLHCGKPLS